MGKVMGVGANRSVAASLWITPRMCTVDLLCTGGAPKSSQLPFFAPFRGPPKEQILIILRKTKTKSWSGHRICFKIERFRDVSEKFSEKKNIFFEKFFVWGQMPNVKNIFFDTFGRSLFNSFNIIGR